MSFTAKGRLGLYEKALEDWKKPSYETTRGFCRYLTLVTGDVYTERKIKRLLPELYNQKPPEEELAEAYWFEIRTERGRYLRRICLIAAIEVVKLKIENDEQK